MKLTAETLASPRLIPEVLASLKTLTPEEFHDKFGDGFVSGMQRGGEDHALYSIFSDLLDIQEEHRGVAYLILIMD